MVEGTAPRVVELFAGVGGFRLALERSGWQTVWANQWEPSTKTQHAFDCYVRHFLPGQVKDTLNEVRSEASVAVNEDIDPDNSDALLWAIAFRMNPSAALQVLNYRSPGHGPEREHETERQDATLLMDATKKEDLPPLALPKKEYMERAGKIWDELGLPKRRPQSPWFSPGDGDWLPQWDEAAKRAVAGRYLDNGKISEKQKRKGLKPETGFRPDD